QQRDIAAEAAKAAGNRDAQQNLRQRQDKVAQETQGLKATEAPVRKAEAAQATKQAQTAMGDKPSDADTLQKLRDAGDKLEALADQLAGRESEAERADRLAKKQEAAARKPSQNPEDTRRQARQMSDEAKQLRAGQRAAAEK